MLIKRVRPTHESWIAVSLDEFDLREQQRARRRQSDESGEEEEDSLLWIKGKNKGQGQMSRAKVKDNGQD